MKLVKSSAAAIGAALVVTAALAVPAHAAPIIECGSYGATSSGQVGWTYGEIEGAGIYNVTTRNVGCSTARRFVRRYRGTDSYYPTWRCREVNDYEFSDIRCTASRGRVIHWQTGA